MHLPNFPTILFIFHCSTKHTSGMDHLATGPQIASFHCLLFHSSLLPSTSVEQSAFLLSPSSIRSRSSFCLRTQYRRRSRVVSFASLVSSNTPLSFLCFIYWRATRVLRSRPELPSSSPGLLPGPTEGASAYLPPRVSASLTQTSSPNPYPQSAKLHHLHCHTGEYPCF
jgi:hypothetical protein